jgi:hypothetical protein
MFASTIFHHKRYLCLEHKCKIFNGRMAMAHGPLGREHEPLLESLKRFVVIWSHTKRMMFIFSPIYNIYNFSSVVTSSISTHRCHLSSKTIDARMVVFWCSQVAW